MEHAHSLAEADASLPPIIVHRPTMRVVDGMHRICAARLRGQRMISVEFVDGSEEAAFVLAVQANVTHGLPLPIRDRKIAARRIVVSHPQWSDRAIAERAGLSADTVASVRAEVSGQLPRLTARIGRDGRVRPVDIAEGRRRAYEVIRRRRDASLREIAAAAGISVGTARDVRSRFLRGVDPVPVRVARSPLAAADPSTVLSGLMNDPALRYSETGRALLRRLGQVMVRQEDIVPLAREVPPHCVTNLARLARGYAQVWLELATRLEADPVRSR